MHLFLIPSLAGALLQSNALPAAPVAPQVVPGVIPEVAPDDRLDALEQRIRSLEADRDRLSTELDAAMDVLAASELEGGGAVADDGPDARTTEIWSRLASRNLAPRAASVYTADGLSIGGYGEFLGQVFRDQDGDNFDALRWVMYFGNRFSERWIFNSEIEIEHGTTSTSSATTDSGGSVSMEFAYIDHLVTDGMALRGGVVLVPLGFVNERHEPTTFLPSARPETEQRIIPSTWRSMALGAYGQTGAFAWAAYAMNGLNGENFDARGLRGGRQSGNRASIDEVAVAGRLDYVGTPGVVVGAAAHTGKAGVGIDEDLRTTILDLHAEWKEGPFSVRALYARADVDDTAAFNTRTGESLAEELQGWYVETGFDLLSLTERADGQTLELFGRYEDLDTQASLAPGATPGNGIDDTFLTLGLNYRPLNQVVVKLDYTWVDVGDDAARFLIGYAF